MTNKLDTQEHDYITTNSRIHNNNVLCLCVSHFKFINNERKNQKKDR